MGKPAATDRPSLRSLNHSFTLDLAVWCPTQEKAIEAHEILSQWLAGRGLRLSDEKTHMRHLRDGCNFLAFTIRHYPAPQSAHSGYKLLIKPSPEAIKDVKRTLKGLWRKHVGSPTVALINEMNPGIRGWSNYFRVGVSQESSRRRGRRPEMMKN